eukprot:CAMPEP_0170553534 /NCGR_PEP_ID=MMETSP0211-20121228/11364_1 /TAXON_ID=311385 /ORGANISM="Pseudokeronopsis sp., Strain OXSARD2" /LENGTH=61 /DNA_ID=CAMNT_0010861933 /DNA_START=765 /DNA_END=950 /DNA_ORIENTATION=-
MGLIALNMFEIFNVFDLTKKGSQNIEETIQNIESQNIIIEKRQESIENELDGIEEKLKKLK